MLFRHEPRGSVTGIRATGKSGKSGESRGRAPFLARGGILSITCGKARGLYCSCAVWSDHALRWPQGFSQTRK